MIIGCGPIPIAQGGPSCLHDDNTPCACYCHLVKKDVRWVWNADGKADKRSWEIIE